jgi:hypothetical protein
MTQHMQQKQPAQQHKSRQALSQRSSKGVAAWAVTQQIVTQQRSAQHAAVPAEPSTSAALSVQWMMMMSTTR